MYHLDHASKFLCFMAGLDAGHCVVLIGPNSLPSFESNCLLIGFRQKYGSRE